MLKINNSSILYKFLFLMLLIGIISNKLGIFTYGMILTFLGLIIFFKLKKNQINSKVLIFFLFGLFILYSNFIYQLLYYGYNNLYFIQFFGSQILFIFLFSFFIEINTFIENYMSKFLFISLLLFSLVISVDYILIDNGLTSLQLAYTENTPAPYLTKPLGLFAQFSVNSTYSVVFYMLFLHFEKKQKSSINITLFLLVTLIIILQNSGTGYIAYLLLIITILYRYLLLRVVLVPLIILSSIFIIQSNIIQKISIDYFYFLFDYFYGIVNVSYIENIHNVYDILLGIDGKYNLPIDFGPIFMIGKVGFLYFLFYSTVLLYMIYKAPSKYLRMVIFILIFGNLHYPTLFYPIMNVLMPILFIYLINKKNIKKANLSSQGILNV